MAIYITVDNFPLIHEACEIVSHDVGAQAGHKSYKVPDTYAGELAGFEEKLRNLSSGDLETFCIGEASQISELTEKHQLVGLSEMLDGLFT